MKNRRKADLKINDNVATSLLASRAMFYYVPFSGWENHNGKLYYRNWDGSYIRNQWAAPTGTTHYFGREGYTINNQWYRMPDSNTYYFDNTGHTVKNRWYVLGNTTYYFKSNGYTAKDQKINIDGTNYVFDINGKHEHEVNIYYFDLNNGVLEVNSDSPTTYLTYKIINKDFMNKVLETTSFYGSVSEDLNKYVGINIEVQLSQMGNVIDSRQFYIASQTPQLSN